MLVVELVRVNLLEHVAAYCRVVSVAQNLAPEKCPNQWISKAYSNRVNKDVTWCVSQSLSAHSIVGEGLPKESPAWVFFSEHRIVAV